jgi:hypothetical protein
MSNINDAVGIVDIMSSIALFRALCVKVRHSLMISRGDNISVDIDI